MNDPKESYDYRACFHRAFAIWQKWRRAECKAYRQFRRDSNDAALFNRRLAALARRTFEEGKTNV